MLVYGSLVVCVCVSERVGRVRVYRSFVPFHPTVTGKDVTLLSVSSLYVTLAGREPLLLFSTVSVYVAKLADFGIAASTSNYCTCMHVPSFFSSPVFLKLFPPFEISLFFERFRMCSFSQDSAPQKFYGSVCVTLLIEGIEVVVRARITNKLTRPMEHLHQIHFYCMRRRCMCVQSL